MKAFFTAIVSCFFLYSSAQVSDKLSAKITEARAYCKKNGFNNQYCFLVDMSIHSGKDRFFVYDFTQNKIIHSGIVCHGYGKDSKDDAPVYSNEVGSNCTSLGKYKIGKRAYSNWGIHVHYKMHGLEKTNSNAFKRMIVLHSYEYIPGEEIYPSYLNMGWSMGCPVVSDNLMTQLDKLLKKTKKPVLLWIFK